jgi:hypothetical protein
VADLLRSDGVDRRRRGKDRRTGEERGELRTEAPPSPPWPAVAPEGPVSSEGGQLASASRPTAGN